MKHRILIVATSRKTRGGITAVIKAHETGEQWKRFHCHWVQTHRDGPSWRKMLYFFTGMMDFLVRLPFYDIVHIHTADYGTEKRKRIFARLTKFFGKKLIVHLHSCDPNTSIQGCYKSVYNYTFSHADKIILLSELWRDIAIDSFPFSSDKLAVVYNPCPVVEPSLLTEREPYILFAGSIIHRKGYDDLIKAFALISTKFPSWRIKLAGNGEIELGKRLAHELGISDKVDFLGWINGKEKDTVFRKASIYCLPSYSEGFPMGVLDAWAYHLPVVTTPVGGLPDVAKDSENMLLFAPGDTVSLSKKLAVLISDKSIYNKLCKASEQFAVERFNIKYITEQLSGIYSDVLKPIN